MNDRSVIALLVASSLLTGCASTRPSPAKYARLSLDWHDEFNLDGPVNDADWMYEEGLVRNQEAQSYRRENVTCKDDLLVIEARREQVPNPAHDAKGTTWKTTRVSSEYSSGSIKTKGHHAWLYGRFEMRARIDVRPGLWPAFWTVGTARSWPACGELDIMEYFKGTLLANAAWGSKTPGKPRWDDSRTRLSEVASPAGVEAWAAEFHVWRMDWDAKTIRFSVDGRVLNEVDLSKTINADGTNPFHEPHHLILNLAIGGTSGGDPSETEFPAKFEVDWVRVYTPRAGCEDSATWDAGPCVEPEKHSASNPRHRMTGSRRGG